MVYALIHVDPDFWVIIGISKAVFNVYDFCEILLGTKPRRHLYRLIAEVKPTVHSDTGWQSQQGEPCWEQSLGRATGQFGYY